MVNLTDFTGSGKMPPQAEQPPVQPGVGAGGEHTPDNHNPGSSVEHNNQQEPVRPFFSNESNIARPWDTPLDMSDEERAFRQTEIYHESTQNYLKAEQVSLEAQRTALEREKLRQGLVASVSHEVFQSRKPHDLFKRIGAPAFDLANVPDVVARFATDNADATGFDRSGLLMAGITAAAAAIHDGTVLEVNEKSDWYESARLWTVILGASGAGKSPILKIATKPIEAIHMSEVSAFLALQRTEDRETHRGLAESALYTSDTTIPAIAEKLLFNDRGMVVIVDEFATLLGSIEASSKGEAAANRGHWLKLYGGGNHQIDRVTSGSKLIPNWGASVLAACPPGELAKFVGALPTDGLVQRFIPVVINLSADNADGDARPANASWSRFIEWVYWNTSPNRVIRFSPAARDLFRSTATELKHFVNTVDEFAPAFASHLNKHDGMIARMALTFHMMENSGSAVLEVTTLQRAINLMSQVRRHSYVLFNDILKTSPAVQLAQQLARSIAATTDPLEFISRQWMSNHCKAFEGTKDDRVRREAVQMLEDMNWLNVPSGTKPYGGWPKQFEVNRQVFRLYAPEGEKHRQRRAIVKDLIGGEGDDG